MKNDLYRAAFSKINLSDERKADLLALAEHERGGASSGKLIKLKKITASAACIAVALAFVLGATLYPRSDEELIDTQPSPTSFSIMQVYADDTKAEISSGRFEPGAPLFQVFREKTTWDNAFDRENQDNEKNEIEENAENNSNAYYFSSEFLPFDANKNNSEGYLITKSRSGSFEINGESVVSAKISMKNGRAICFLGAGLPIKSGNEITLTGEDIKNERCQLFFDFSDEIWNKRFLADDFSFSELNDEMTFSVTTEESGVKRTEEITVLITFDDDGIMHTAIKK